MLEVPDKRMYNYLNDYKLNLISPIDISEEDFEKFHTDLGLAMKVIKHQKEDADTIIKGTNHRKIDHDTAFFLNRAVNLGLEYEEENGGIDMCLALDKKYKEKEITGAIKVLRSLGTSESDIKVKIIEMFDVTTEYVTDLLSPQKT